MIKIVFLLQLFAVIFVNAHLIIQPRIIGGQTAVPNSAPSIVSVQHDSEHICGGAIISSQFVITSATCVLYYFPNRILAGTQKLFTNAKRYTIEYTVAHEDFNGDTDKNDLGLIKIEDTFPITNQIKVIQFNRNTALKSNSVTDFYGWGYLDAGDEERPNDLQVVYQKLLNNMDCKKYYQNNVKYTENHFCALIKAHQGACNEDIGGPLILNGELVGILNWVTNCGTGKPDVFLNIAMYGEWIDRQLEVVTTID